MSLDSVNIVVDLYKAQSPSSQLAELATSAFGPREEIIGGPGVSQDAHGCQDPARTAAI